MATAATTTALTDATGSVPSTTALSSAVNKTMGKEDFLKLLTTQLKYQDPLSPEDPKDFVAQLAQFSALEQQLNTNTNLENLGTVIQKLKNSQSMAQGVGLLGKTVKGSGNMLTVAGGKASTVSFELPLDAKEVEVGIFDPTGKQVRTLNLGSQAAGVRSLAWDGKDSQGKTVSDGLYSYQVAATDKTGKAMQVTNYFTGKVQEVFQNSQGVWVTINGRQVMLDNIISVGEGS